MLDILSGRGLRSDRRIGVDMTVNLGREMADRLLRIKEVCQFTALGETKLREMVDAGKFPRAKQVGPRAVRWRVSDVDAWIESLPEATGVIHDDRPA